MAPVSRPAGPPGPEHIMIFNGDFVDRGACGLEAPRVHACGLEAPRVHACGLEAPRVHACGLEAPRVHACGLKAS